MKKYSTLTHGTKGDVIIAFAIGFIYGNPPSPRIVISGFYVRPV